MKLAAHGGGLIIVTGVDVHENDQGEIITNPVYYHHVVARRSEVEAIAWPANDGTGAPGRPSKNSADIMAEHERRWIAGECAPGRMAEAAALVQWFKEKHPGRDAPTAKTIFNKLPAGRYQKK